MRADNPIRNFDPRKVAHYEKENYVAYYQKDWLKLFRVSIAMVKEAFALSWPQALYGAYLVARAEMAAAPFPENDIPLAERYMHLMVILYLGRLIILQATNLVIVVPALLEGFIVNPLWYIWLGLHLVRTAKG